MTHALPPVLPARAGVSRRRQRPDRAGTCPPRASGGQPNAFAGDSSDARSSPRERGSAVGGGGAHEDGAVLPARAGVSRGPPASRPETARPPRASGGQPRSCGGDIWPCRSSPRERGSAVAIRCTMHPLFVLPARAGVSRPAPWGTGREDVLPARAGVSRWSRRRPRLPSGPPRASGGQPPPGLIPRSSRSSSPRERGSAGWDTCPRLHVFVLPARAGVSRPRGRPPGPRGRPPRASGGQPDQHGPRVEHHLSSPRERGSAADDVEQEFANGVLPARAGVSRRRAWPGRCASSPPRASGGQPPDIRIRGTSRWSSPRERGSAAEQEAGVAGGRVLPARAGVSRPDVLRPRP